MNFQSWLALERQISEQSRTAWRKLLHDCEILQQRFEECKINLADNEEENLIKNFQSLPDAMHLLTTSENQVNLLLTEVLPGFLFGICPHIEFHEFRHDACYGHLLHSAYKLIATKGLFKSYFTKTEQCFQETSPNCSIMLLK